MFEGLKRIVAAIVAFFTALFGGGGKLPYVPISNATQTIVMRINPINGIRQFEGACCDGEYVYINMINPAKDSKQGSVIVKIDPSGDSWKSVLVSKEMTQLNHANDMTYDPRIDLLMVSNNAPNYTLVSAVYRDTLEYKAGMTIEHPLYSLCYYGTPEKGRYLAGISGTYTIGSYDGKFDTIETFDGINSGYTRQSLATDNEYLYFLFSGPNCIYKYTIDGQYIGRSMLPDPEKADFEFEAEGIFFYNDKMYVTYNIPGAGNGGIICRVDKISFVK